MDLHCYIMFIVVQMTQSLQGYNPAFCDNLSILSKVLPVGSDSNHFIKIKKGDVNENFISIFNSGHG